MGDAAIYYYPGPSRALHTVDLGLGLSSINDWAVGVQATATAYSGRRSRHIFYQERIVRATIRQIRDVSVVRQLESLEAHLKAGRPISLAEDADATFAGFVEYPPVAGATTLRVWGNQFSGYGSVTSVTTGDTLIIQGPSPEQRREALGISSRSALTVSLANAVLQDYDDLPWLMVRDRRFWPLLYLQDGQESAELLRPTDDTRLTWDMTLPLVERASVGEELQAQGYDYAWPVEEDEGPILGGGSGVGIGDVGGVGGL